MDDVLMMRTIARGDVLMTTPVIRKFRELNPGGLIHYVTYYPEVLDGNPYVNRVFLAPFEAEQIQPSNYTRLVNFMERGAEPFIEQFFEPLPPYLDRLMQYDPKDPMRVTLKRTLMARGIHGFHMTELFAKVARVELDDFHYDFSVFERSLKIVGEFFNFAESSPFYNTIDDVICVHTTAATEDRNWPLENFNRVAAWLFRGGWTVVQVGGEADGELACSLDFRGASINETAAMLMISRGCICVDSFVGHLASAVGCQPFVVMGWTDPRVTAPPGAICIQNPSCNSCMQPVCGKDAAQHMMCMNDLPPSSVIKKIMSYY